MLVAAVFLGYRLGLSCAGLLATELAREIPFLYRQQWPLPQRTASRTSAVAAGQNQDGWLARLPNRCAQVWIAEVGGRIGG